jgi:Na+/H+ antiporter NhaC
MQNFYIYTFYFLFFLFFYFFFGVGPSSAHMDWARPSQPGPATGPSQWPGWAQQHACCCTVQVNFTLEVMQKTSLTWSAEGDEDDGDVPPE